jgi:uncharacterized membrane protein
MAPSAPVAQMDRAPASGAGSMGSSPVGGTNLRPKMSETNPNPPNPETDISEDDKLLAILAYVPGLCLLPFLRTDRSEFVSAHVRLGMTLFAVEVFAIILRYLRVVWDIVLFLCVIAALVGIYHVVRGRLYFLPYLSDLFSKKQ